MSKLKSVQLVFFVEAKGPLTTDEIMQLKREAISEMEKSDSNAFNNFIADSFYDVNKKTIEITIV